MAVSSQAATVNNIDSDRIEFVIGNIVFVALHEFSHLIIEDFDIPVLGNGEDAADTLAAISLIHMDRAHPERDFPFIAMLLSAADANAIIYRVDSQANTKVPFFDTARLREVLTPILGQTTGTHTKTGLHKVGILSIQLCELSYMICRHWKVCVPKVFNSCSESTMSRLEMVYPVKTNVD
jgi:hypothetical protein